MMDDLAQQAYSTKNYDLACEIYDRRIREFGPTVQLYMGLGDSYAGAGLLDKAFSTYSKAFRLGNINPDQLNNLVDALVEKMGDDLKSKTKTKDEDNIFACHICKGIWNDPVTISCGHSFCRNCLEKSASMTCNKCEVLHNHRNFTNLRTSVILSSVIKKWFADEVKAAQLKADGNAFFSARRYKEAVHVYTEAIKLAPSDHLLRSNRSLVFESMDQHKEALQDAEETIQLRPDWAKGYYRKGAALSGLSCYEAAATAFLQCLTLDSSVSSARSALAKALHKTLSPLQPEDVKMAELQGVMAGPFSRTLTSSRLQASDMGPASLLNSGHNVDLLLEIKERLGQSLLESGVMTEGASQPAPTSETKQTSSVASPASGSNLDEQQSHLLYKKSSTEPSSRSSSPKLIPRQGPHGSHTSLTDSETNLTRKRSSENLQKEATCCASRSPPKKKSIPGNTPGREVKAELLEQEDFECALCYRLLFNPVTTPCGHTYCRGCLDRSLDHKSSCPLCKSCLVEYLAERRQVVTEAVELIIQTYFHDAYAERKKVHEEELANLARIDADQFEIPIFVCTLSYPTIPCPLHVFEPRYRLMIRQCMEAGTRQFGMCVCLANDEGDFADFGTMLEVRNMEFFPDGRSVVDTVGGRRFKVISRGHRDGYNTAIVEYIKDLTVPEGQETQELSNLHDQVFKEAKDWFSSEPSMLQQQIRTHFGQFPELEPNHLHLDDGPAWLWWLTAVMPLDSRAQLTILAQKRLRDRLTYLRRVLQYVQRPKRS